MAVSSPLPGGPADATVSTLDACRSVSAHTRHYLADALGMPLLSELPDSLRVDELCLKDVTAIMALGGSASLWVAFSADLGLAEEILRLEMAECGGVRVDAPSAQLQAAAAALAEVANVVLGHCATELSDQRGLVSLTIPTVIGERRVIRRADAADFAAVSLQTSQGELLIACIAPRGYFDAQLNPKVPDKEEA